MEFVAIAQFTLATMWYIFRKIDDHKTSTVAPAANSNKSRTRTAIRYDSHRPKILFAKKITINYTIYCSSQVIDAVRVLITQHSPVLCSLVRISYVPFSGNCRLCHTDFVHSILVFSFKIEKILSIDRMQMFCYRFAIKISLEFTNSHTNSQTERK